MLEVKRIWVAEVIVEGVDILEKIKKLEAKDDEVVKAVEEMKKAGCYDSESNPRLLLVFKGLLNNLRDYNASQSINSTGQVTILCK